MNKSLDRILRSYSRLGYTTSVVDAPKEAVTFDKMVVVYLENNIHSLLLYDTKTEFVVGSY